MFVPVLQQVQYVWGGDVTIMWAAVVVLRVLLFMLPEDALLHVMWHINANFI